jgi:hypothetical protein
LRLTVQSEQNAPTLTLTDRAPGSLLVCRRKENEPVTLSAIEATAHDPDSTLKVELGDLPESSVLTDGTHTFTASALDTTADITNWQRDQLTLALPPDTPDSPYDFTLRVQVTQTDKQDANTGEQKPLTTTAGLRVITPPVKPGKTLETPDNESRTREPEALLMATPSASASVTFHSRLPETPFASRRQGQTGYLLLNHHGPEARQRRKSEVPLPKIDWNGKVDLSDLKITDPAWVAEVFDSLKEKPRTLGEITGLVFKLEDGEYKMEAKKK